MVKKIFLNQIKFEKRDESKVKKSLTENDIFAEDFYFLEGKGNLPGALLPKDVDEITYTIEEQEHHLTPLLPLKPEILSYFSPEELINGLTFIPTTIGNKSGVTVSLRLSVSESEFTIKRNYLIKPDNALTAKPFLEIWPNFQAPNWKAYYIFYFDDRIEATQENTTFRAIFPEAIGMEQHPTDLRHYQWTRLESFPKYIICQDENDPTLIKGLILLKTPPDVGYENPNKTWKVGVDFNPSFTNVCYQINNFISNLTLTPLHLQVTQTALSSRLVLLYDYFMSAEDETFPLSTVLTIRGSHEQERPILDGRVYILEDVRAFDPNQDDIKTNLEWKLENISYNRTFLSHLALLIAAESAKNDVRKIEWSMAYPPSFSRTDKNLYRVTWKRILEYIYKVTGIEHQNLRIENMFRSTNMAVAQYFIDYEDKDLVGTTCIYLNDQTSDIAIWASNCLIHQFSLKLTKRHLFSQFWKNRPTFLNQQFNADLTDLTSDLRDEPFFMKLDNLLSAEGDNWLAKNRTLMGDDPNLQSIVQLSTVAISGLYYYIGLVLRALDLQGKYTQKQNTYVCIGGNGSSIFNWLDLSGRFMPNCDASLLFSRMLSKGSGFKDNREKTVISRNPGSEVAFGLALPQGGTQLTELQEENDCVFAGEDCEVNGVSFDWNHRLDLRQFRKIESFEMSSLENEEIYLSNLKQFLDNFQQAFQDLKIISIKPLIQYEDEQWRDSLWKGVKRRVEADLIKLEGHDSEDIEVEPLFIIGLNALLKELNEKLEGSSFDEDNEVE